MTRGGKRTNSGRKKSQRGKMVSLLISIYPDQATALDQSPSGKSATVRTALDLYFDLEKPEDQ